MFWDGVKWVLDADAEAMMLLMQFADECYSTARMHMQIATDKGAQARAKSEFMAASKLRTATGVNHMITLTKAIVNEPHPELYDQDAWDLNTPDGLVDLKTGEIRNHDQHALCTKCTAVSPGSAGVEKWYQFISHITAGDQSFAEYLQLLAGMAAVGAVYEEGLVISHGSGGNGKSTFFGALVAVLGDYARTVNADVMVANNAGKTDQTYIAALRGARLAVLGETEEGARLSIAQMKRITSQDVITARELYKNPIEFRPSHTTVMHTNHLPKLGSLDGGTRRRIAVAPFPATLPPEKVVTNYCQVLVRECGGAILQWIIDGAKKFYNVGCKLAKPETVERATRKYVENEDWLGAFIDDCCDVGPAFQQPAGELYAAYQRWANAQGEYVWRNNSFAQALETKGYVQIKPQNRKHWVGLKLREEL
jgi:P4 family phage/plasmid primase-like protien